jgi:uncharacterized damage-inducible protein DinB
MKNFLIILICYLPVSVFGQDSASFNKDLTGMLAFNEQRVLELAEAFPAEKFDWRPAEGIRSVGEAFLHMAGANYYFLMQLGFTPPEGVDLQNMESIKGKEKVMEALKGSFAFAKEKIPEVEDLDTMVEFPFAELSKQSALLLLLEHSGEHKGQLIAYARMNGVTPPWSE